MICRFQGAIPAADFARVVRASSGAHRRPLHPRLAPLCVPLLRPPPQPSQRHARLSRRSRQQHRPTGTLSSTTLIDKEELPRRDCHSLQATDLSCHLSHVASAPFKERPTKYRGARTEVIGKISDIANSPIALHARYARGERLELPDWLCPRSTLRERNPRSKRRRQ
jgi:hypothetical protein